MTSDNTELINGIRTTLRVILTLQGYPYFSGPKAHDPLTGYLGDPSHESLEFSLPLSAQDEDSQTHWIHRKLPDTEDGLKSVLRDLILERRRVEGMPVESRRVKYWSASPFQKQYFTLAPETRTGQAQVHDLGGVLGGLGATSSFEIPEETSRLSAQLERFVMEDPSETQNEQLGAKSDQLTVDHRRVELPKGLIQYALRKWQQDTSDSREGAKDLLKHVQSTLTDVSNEETDDDTVPDEDIVEDVGEHEEAKSELDIQPSEDDNPMDTLLSPVTGDKDDTADTSQMTLTKTTGTLRTGKTQKRRERAAARAQKEAGRESRFAANAKRAASLVGSTELSLQPEEDDTLKSDDMPSPDVPDDQMGSTFEQSAYERLVSQGPSGLRGKQRKLPAARHGRSTSGSNSSRFPPLPFGCTMSRAEVNSLLGSLLEGLSEGEKRDLLTAIDDRKPKDTRITIIAKASDNLGNAIEQYNVKANPVVFGLAKRLYESQFRSEHTFHPDATITSLLEGETEEHKLDMRMVLDTTYPKEARRRIIEDTTNGVCETLDTYLRQVDPTYSTQPQTQSQDTEDFPNTVSKSQASDTDLLESLLEGKSEQHQKDARELISADIPLGRKLFLIQNDPDNVVSTVGKYMKQTRPDLKPRADAIMGRRSG